MNADPYRAPSITDPAEGNPMKIRSTVAAVASASALAIPVAGFTPATEAHAAYRVPYHVLNTTVSNKVLSIYTARGCNGNGPAPRFGELAVGQKAKSEGWNSARPQTGVPNYTRDYTVIVQQTSTGKVLADRQFNWYECFNMYPKHSYTVYAS